MMSVSSLVFSSFVAASTLTAEIPQNETQPHNAISQDEIIVDEPSEGRERRNELRQFARDVLNKPNLRQTVSSYSVAMCPRVFGLSEEDALAIEARMRANAIELGANRTDPSQNCVHNTSVIFVPADQGTADQWLDHGSKPLRHLRTFERSRVLSEEGPVRAWTYRERPALSPSYVQATPGLGGGSFTFASGGFELFEGRNSPNPLVGSVVIIEVESANAKSLTQLADYASMRTFANTRGIDPEAVPAAQTILTLFQDDDAPEELTVFDRSIIAGLYATPDRASKSQFYGNIARRAQRLETMEEASLLVP